MAGSADTRIGVSTIGDCVENITIGDFPNMILQSHQEYLRGYNAANDSGNSMCPISENAAFCRGWDSNNDDYGDQDCGDEYANYTGPITNLVGCPLDTLKQNQIGAAALSILIGTWNYVNESRGPESKSMGTDDMPMTSLGISGKIVYGKYGDFHLTVPNKTGFGDYALEGSWAYVGHNILTQCYAGECENNTLTITASNHIQFTDNHDNIINLIR
jgi:hypothetical protein